MSDLSAAPTNGAILRWETGLELGGDSLEVLW